MDDKAREEFITQTQAELVRAVDNLGRSVPVVHHAIFVMSTYPTRIHVYLGAGLVVCSHGCLTHRHAWLCPRVHRVDDAEWARYKGLALPEGSEGAQRAGPKPVAKEVTKQSWSDKIIVSQDMQVRVRTACVSMRSQCADTGAGTRGCNVCVTMQGTNNRSPRLLLSPPLPW
jgi:hypothetical protein